MQSKRFQKNDSAFVCHHCGRQVPENGVTSRDHCPYCLYSLHVDLLPGDRANPCRGVLVPKKTRPHPKKGFIITYQCQSCKEIVRNKAAITGCVPDDTDLLIRLTAVTEDF